MENVRSEGAADPDWEKVAAALVLTGHLSADETPEWVVGQRVARLRRVRGLTQDQLADHLASHGHDMHQSTVAKLEAGKRPIRVNELVALARILGVSAHELITDGELEHAGELAVAERELRAARAQEAATARELRHVEQKLREVQAQRDYVADQARVDRDRVAGLEARVRELGRGN